MNSAIKELYEVAQEYVSDAYTSPADYTVQQVEDAYAKYMTSFKAEHMDGEVVDWEINCVKPF